jgi:hypothetical protein
MKVFLPLIALSLCAAIARAQDRFEIQVYDSETAPPLSPGLELHTNYSVQGTLDRTSEGELPTNHVARITFEPHLGLNEFSEAGAYFQTALRPSGAYDYAGVKLRFKMRYLHKLWDLVGLAVNFEVSRVPRAYESTRWGSEVRPIADIHWRWLYASVNPIVAIEFKGRDAGLPQLHPAAKVAITTLQALQIGAEYYADFGPITAPLPGPEQRHTLYGAIDFTSSYVDLNLGVGHGFAASDRWVIKSILGFHPKP